jgi:hypothetical protein
MPGKKHYVFSARTTREGLRQLNDVKRERGVSWDDLVIDAVCAHYGLDRFTLALPKVEKATKVETKTKVKPGPKAKAKPKAVTELSKAAEEPEAKTNGAVVEG